MSDIVVGKHIFESGICDYASGEKIEGGIGEVTASREFLGSCVIRIVPVMFLFVASIP